MKLVIGNKNYSTWSLRPWLLLCAFGIEFEEVQESLKMEGLKQRLLKHSPTAKVPVLIDSTLTVSDSLAICEYISETSLAGRGWPGDPIRRAEARAISAEMHSGFGAIRSELPMNCRASRKIELSSQVQAEIARIDSIWSDCNKKYGDRGPWLFGEFSIADCFFAPVALRFLTYGVPLSIEAQRFATEILAHPCVIDWVKSAKKETEIIAEDEAGTD